MFVYRTIEKTVFWKFDSIIMQNMSHNLLLFFTQTWPSPHVIENHLYKSIVFISEKISLLLAGFFLKLFGRAKKKEKLPNCDPSYTEDVFYHTCSWFDCKEKLVWETCGWNSFSVPHKLNFVKGSFVQILVHSCTQGSGIQICGENRHPQLNTELLLYSFKCRSKI